MKIKNIFITKKGECNCKSMSLVPFYKSVIKCPIVFVVTAASTL